MNQNTFAIILDLISRYGVQAVLGLIADFKKTEVTEADWQALIAQIQTSFEAYQTMAAKVTAPTA